MQTLEESYDQVLLESSLSRIYNYVVNFDCAIITAFRDKKESCVASHDDKPTGSKYSKKENRERNKKLMAALLGLGYGVTPMNGLYIENFGTDKAVPRSEESYFVVNRHNNSKFFHDIIKLGKYFCQDSVLLKPKNDKDAYLYGTNNASFPGLDQKATTGPFHAGFERMFMSSVRNRPFSFDDEPVKGFTPYLTTVEAFDNKSGEPNFMHTEECYNLSTRAYFFQKAKKEILND